LLSGGFRRRLLALFVLRRSTTDWQSKHTKKEDRDCAGGVGPGKHIGGILKLSDKIVAYSVIFFWKAKAC
jgi:hypothetical protein